MSFFLKEDHGVWDNGVFGTLNSNVTSVSILPIHCITIRGTLLPFEYNGTSQSTDDKNYDQPLLAKQLLNCVVKVLIERWCYQYIGKSAMQKDLRRELIEALLLQIKLRGFTFKSYAFQMASKATIYKRGKEAVLVLNSGDSEKWFDDVDNKLQAGPCDACGQKVPIPSNHYKEYCDMHVVKSVIEV